jgi:hypothetical protein
LVLALVFGLQADALGILPKDMAREEVASHELDLDSLLASNQVLDLANAGKPGGKLLGHGT